MERRFDESHSLLPGIGVKDNLGHPLLVFHKPGSGTDSDSLSRFMDQLFRKCSWSAFSWTTTLGSLPFGPGPLFYLFFPLDLFTGLDKGLTRRLPQQYVAQDTLETLPDGRYAAPGFHSFSCGLFLFWFFTLFSSHLSCFIYVGRQ